MRITHTRLRKRAVLYIDLRPPAARAAEPEPPVWKKVVAISDNPRAQAGEVLLPVDATGQTLLDRCAEIEQQTGPWTLALVDLTGAATEAITYEIDEARGRANRLLSRRHPVNEIPLTAAAAEAAFLLGEEWVEAGKRHVVLVCGPPPRNRMPWQAGKKGRTGVCIETPDRISKALISELEERAHTGLPTTTDTQLPPLPLTDLPPSPWGSYSPQQRVLARTYDWFARHRDEEMDPAARRQVIPKLLARLLGDLPPTPSGPRALSPSELLSDNFYYLLRLARRATTWRMENRPVRCTLVLAAGEAYERALTQPQPVPEGAPRCYPCVLFPMGQGFHLNEDQLRDHTELVQADGLALFVDKLTLDLRGAVSFYHAHDLYRGPSCRRLAHHTGGLVFHIRDGQIEVYDHKYLQLWYDGFAWRADPFGLVRARLVKFFEESDETKVPGDTGFVPRLVAALSYLLDERASSLLAFVKRSTCEGVDLNGRPFLAGAGAGDPWLTPLRAGIRSAVLSGTPYVRPIEDLPLSALAGLLQVDGTHLITDTGELVRLAHHVQPNVRPDRNTYPGTGRAAARQLSEALADTGGFVIKVSSSGNLHVFENGVPLSSFRPSEGQDRPPGTSPPPPVEREARPQPIAEQPPEAPPHVR
jgi:hypothetical protein